MLFLLDSSTGLRRRPDVAYVSTERWAIDRPIPRGENALAVVPDLAVEVVSPSNFADEMLAKVEDYFRVGVRLVWVVYPSQNLVYAYESARVVKIRGGVDDLEGNAVLPGFRMSIRALFGVNDAAADATT